MSTRVVEAVGKRTVVRRERRRRRRGDCGVSQLLRTVLVPPALRKDTQWLPQQLHLALLILQF